MDTTPAAEVVDLAGLPSQRVGPEGDVAVEEPAVRGIEGLVVDQEGAVLLG